MTKQTQKVEFPKGKESYCPRCYFELDEALERDNCKCKQD